MAEDMELREENALNWGKIGRECPRCGIDLWVVDGDGDGKFWYLCSGVNDPSCTETCDSAPEQSLNAKSPEDIIPLPVPRAGCYVE